MFKTITLTTVAMIGATVWFQSVLNSEPQYNPQEFAQMKQCLELGEQFNKEEGFGWDFSVISQRCSNSPVAFDFMAN